MSNLFKYCLYKSAFYKEEIITVFLIPILAETSALGYLVFPTCGISDRDARHNFLRATPFKKLSVRGAIKTLDYLLNTIDVNFIDFVKIDTLYDNTSEVCEIRVEDPKIKRWLPEILSKLRERVKYINYSNGNAFETVSTDSDTFKVFNLVVGSKCKLFKI